MFPLFRLHESPVWEGWWLVLAAQRARLFSERVSRMSAEVSPLDDVIDVRDVIARFEELAASAGDHDESELAEFALLGELLGELKGNGGDEQWRGDWYPVTLVRDSYFKEYAQELAEEIGAIPEDASWPAYCIDWDRAARELRMDYFSVEFDGVTFWTR